MATSQMRYIGLWRRVGARAIDWAGLMLFSLMLVNAAKPLIADPRLRLLVLGAVGLVVAALYYIVVQGWRGQTLGKLATRIEVRLVDGAPFTYRAAVWRHAVDLTLGVVILVATHFELGLVSFDDPRTGREQLDLSQGLIWGWYLVEAIVLAGNTQKRAVHDFIADTVVVGKARRPRASSIAGGGVFDAAPNTGRVNDGVNGDNDENDDEDREGESVLDDRVLCRDGSCVGVIGPDGRCKVCGKSEDWRPE